MAAVTSLGSLFATTAGDKTVTATPAVGDLIVIFMAATSISGGALVFSDNNAGGAGTYSKITGSDALVRASVDEMTFYVRDALIATGGAASTIFTMDTVTNGAVHTGGGIQVFKITGMTRAGLSAIRQSAAQGNQAASGTPTPVLGAAMLTGNAGIGAVLNATSPATMTPRVSWTEQLDTGFITPTTGVETMSRDSGETASSIAWGGTSASAFGSSVIELDTSAPGASTSFSFAMVF